MLGYYFAPQMTHVCWWYYFSKFTEFFDTVINTICILFENNLKLIRSFLSIQVLLRVTQEERSGLCSSRRSSRYHADERLVRRKIHTRGTRHFLRDAQHFRAHHHVFLLHGGCPGPKVRQIHLVEKVPHRPSNGTNEILINDWRLNLYSFDIDSICWNLHSRLPAFLHRMRFPHSIRLVDRWTWGSLPHPLLKFL